MKRLGLLALPLLLAACNNTSLHVPSGSVFDPRIGGGDMSIVYQRTYTANRVWVKSSYKLERQPRITAISPAGSVGGIIESVEVAVYDQNGKLMPLSPISKDPTMPRPKVNNPYTTSYTALIPNGWGCKNSVTDVLEPVVDSVTCPTDRLGGLPRWTVLSPEFTTSISLERHNYQFNTQGLIPLDIAAAIAEFNDDHKSNAFNGYLIATFKGQAHNGAPFAIKSSKIELTVSKLEDQQETTATTANP